MVCDKCKKCGGILFLVAGIIYLVTDTTTWNFWNIQWYTVLFLIIGLKLLGTAHCKDCQACEVKKK